MKISINNATFRYLFFEILTVFHKMLILENGQEKNMDYIPKVNRNNLLKQMY